MKKYVIRDLELVSGSNDLFETDSLEEARKILPILHKTARMYSEIATLVIVDNYTMEILPD